jgi:two-component system KDP operon response regulator KdpE
MKIFIANTDNEISENIILTLNIYQPDWQISVTSDRRQCLEVIRNGSCPDAIILEMGTRDQKCIKLIEHIRKASNVPVVVVSRDKDMTSLVKAFEAGANEYMTKPFIRQIFIARLKAIIKRSRIWNAEEEKENLL